MNTSTHDSVVPAVQVVPTLSDVVEAEWNSLTGPDDFYLSHQWLRVVERDGAARARYLLAVLSGTLVGVLPIYNLRHGGDLYRPQRFRELLDIDGDYLIAGARMGTRNALLLADALPAPLALQTARSLIEAALSTAVSEDLEGIVLPYLPTQEAVRIGKAVPAIAAPDSGEAVIGGLRSGFDAYLSRLSGSGRYKARKEMTRYAAAGWRDATEPLADCLPEVARLISAVEGRHGANTPEFLMRRMFRREEKIVGRQAIVLTCRDEDSALVACALCYAWHGVLYGHALGLDYARLRGSYEYFNVMFYRAIRYAADHGFDRLNLGLTTPAKTRRGARTNPLWTAAVPARESGDRLPGLKVRSGAGEITLAREVLSVATLAGLHQYSGE